MDLQARFPFFSRLPNEIQDTIWTTALDMAPPTAYFGRIEEIGDLEEGVSKVILRRLCLPHEHSSTPPPWNTMETLMQTCQRSRATVSLHCQRHQPTYILELAVSWSQYHKGHYLVRISLNASSDLLILDGNWLDERWLGDVYRFLYCFNNTSETNIFLHNTGILEIFYDLEVLYVMLEPTQLEEVTEDWPYHHDHVMPLRPYLEAHYGKGGPAREFHAFGRRYFEVSPMKLASLGGLRKFVSILGSKSYYANVNQILASIMTNTDYGNRVAFVVRVMTWRNE
ncbi:hypothetical protein F4811DRAFT_564085 [Daldinia bambusicola]|nr:hypothetical protein F4811DRAFT_564085 [Daldinia bambusicola]